MKSKLLLFLVIMLASMSTGWLCADESEDEKAIRNSVTTYVTAFNRQDAKAIAALWSPEAVYTNPKTGEEVVGRDAIEQQLVEIFSQSKDCKLEVAIESIRFLSPNVAVEQGISRILRPGEEADETAYTAVYVKSGGNWLLDQMSEEAVTVFRSNYQHLKDLEWLIGAWVDEEEQARIESNAKWTKNQNFISQMFKVSVPGETELSGIQLIGWDPVTKNIRSWVFDSDGGFGNATWKKKGNQWIIEATATLPDGRRSSEIRTITLLDDNSITWQASNRELGGEILPNIAPIKITNQSKSE
jgi:uncharacterized protein (TIGR02246 family)